MGNGFETSEEKGVQDRPLGAIKKILLFIISFAVFIAPWFVLGDSDRLVGSLFLLTWFYALYYGFCYNSIRNDKEKVDEENLYLKEKLENSIDKSVFTCIDPAKWERQVKTQLNEGKDHV